MSKLERRARRHAVGRRDRDAKSSYRSIRIAQVDTHQCQSKGGNRNQVRRFGSDGVPKGTLGTREIMQLFEDATQQQRRRTLLELELRQLAGLLERRARRVQASGRLNRLPRSIATIASEVALSAARSSSTVEAMT